MKNLIQNLIARLRGHHDTDGVLASFRKSVDRLEGVIERHTKLSDAKAQAARAAERAAYLAREEAKKAAGAVTRLKAVFGE